MSFDPTSRQNNDLTRVPPNPGKRGRKLDRQSTFWFLYLPPLIWLGLFFLAPLLLMAAFSFRADSYGSLFENWVPGFDQELRFR